jgi:RNA polymerase sigma-70 factor, ECF subfamily
LSWNFPGGGTLTIMAVVTLPQGNVGRRIVSMNGDQHEAPVAQLLATHQQRLSAFIRQLIPLRSDAEDVLQEVNLFIWQHADEFQPGSNFAAWAYQIARNRVMNFYKKKPVKAVRFSQTVLEQLAAGADIDGDFSPSRLRALEQCLQKLSAKDQTLAVLRYESGATTQSVAERSKRSLKGVYHSLNRIRMTLLDCIQRTLASEAR